jgi:hypothetical protein
VPVCAGVVNTLAPLGTPTCTRVFINEINYRNVTFTGMQITPTEAIEIAGPAGTDLTDMKWCWSTLTPMVCRSRRRL